MKSFAIISFFLLLGSYGFGQDNSSMNLTSNVSIIITTNQELTYQLPKREEDWFDISFKFSVNNNSEHDIKIVHPNSYKIFPHPWMISCDNIEAKKWSGDPMCAPSFEEDNKILIKAGESKEFKFYWSEFTKSFSKTPGKHRVSLKYQFQLADTWTMGAEKNGLTEINSGWSNVIEIEIKN